MITLCNNDLALLVTRNDSVFFGDHTDRLKIKEKKYKMNTVWKKTFSDKIRDKTVI